MLRSNVYTSVLSLRSSNALQAHVREQLLACVSKFVDAAGKICSDRPRNQGNWRDVHSWSNSQILHSLPLFGFNNQLGSYRGHSRPSVLRAQELGSAHPTGRQARVGLLLPDTTNRCCCKFDVIHQMTSGPLHGRLRMLGSANQL